MNYNNDEPLALDLSRYEFDSEKAAFAEVVSDETENHRVALGGVRGGNRAALLASLLMQELPTSGHYADRAHWFEYLTDSKVIHAVGRRLNLNPIEFLSMCMKTFRLPNWETLFWMKAFYESVTTGHQIELQFAQREQAIVKQTRSEMAKIGALAKLADDPKQREKAQVRECWEDWQRTPLNFQGKRKYKGKEAFAKDMLDKYGSLESAQVIARWCRDWAGEAVTQPAQ